MLSMESALFRQNSSRAKVTDASRDLGCDPWSTHQSRPAYQTGALASAGGVYIRRGGLLRHVAILNIRSKWQGLKIVTFCYESMLWKIRSHAQSPCAQVSSWSIFPFNIYPRKTGPREAETDSRYLSYINIFLQCLYFVMDGLFIILLISDCGRLTMRCDSLTI